MATRAYKSINFRRSSLDRLEDVLQIVDTFKKAGYKMSLRQLFYQLVASDIIPNDNKEYSKLGTLIANARLVGLIDWDAIEDRNRTPETPHEYDNLTDLINAAIRSYRLPRLKGQETYIELYSEKAALASVLKPLAKAYHITLMVNRGYSSLSAMMESAQRIDRACRYDYPSRKEGQLCVDEAVILYLGDLDPSGEDMVRDIEDRLTMLLNGGEGETHECESPTGWNLDAYGIGAVPLRVEKLALTMEQVKEYNPPPNPAKKTDSRSKEFIRKYGASSWEVDALRPDVLGALIREAFESYLDLGKMQKIIDQEKEDIAKLRELTRQS